MIKTFNSTRISDEDCIKIINSYESKLSLQENDIRRQSNFHETNKDSWLFKLINQFIKNTIGNKYFLIERVTILKYTSGDFFLTHRDGDWNSSLSNYKLPYHFYGGLELNEKAEYEGGEFYINSSTVEHRKGRLFTHGFSDLHGVKKVKSGIRWSLHFLIGGPNIQSLI